VASRSGTLFLTDHLSIGGAQRSLLNLLGNYPRPAKNWLCVLEASDCQGYLDEAERSGTTVFSMQDAADYLERVERILGMIELLKVRQVCFWNVEPRVKLLLAKILPAGVASLTDVSPGPFMFKEMEDAAVFQHRIAFTAGDYWRRLDHFVAKYTGGVPKDFPNREDKAVVIPNGVVLPGATDMRIATLPPGADPDLLVGAVCRIAPGKRIDFLIEVMADLNRKLKGANLVIVGGVEQRHVDYWARLQEQLNLRRMTNIHFAGPHHEVTPFLRRFKVLVMMSETPGCPNASLEAMALGVPVVANAAGGMAEQVIHGINGFLINGNDPKEMSQFVRYLLANKEVRQRFGEAAKITAANDFSIKLMAQRYAKLLETPGIAPATTKKISRSFRSSKNKPRTNPALP
jgi:glycosyltransferase involved in cell wall biosynthesis